MSEAITAKTPWVKNLGDVPAHLDYFQGSMYEAVERIAQQSPNAIAFDFMGRSTSYKKMIEEIQRCAKSLRTIGVREGDCVTIAMPNCPQAIYVFYAANLIGAIANMVHPLSSEKEIEFYINESKSVTVVTLDQFYHKVEGHPPEHLCREHRHRPHPGRIIQAFEGWVYAHRGTEAGKNPQGRAGHPLGRILQPGQSLLLEL